MTDKYNVDNDCRPETTRMPAPNSGLAKVAVSFSADTFVVKIATFAKPQTVMRHFNTTSKNMKPIVIIAFLTILLSKVFGQTKDSLYKLRISEMTKEMEMMKQHLMPQTIDNFAPYFKPEIIDTFFNYINMDNFK